MELHDVAEHCLVSTAQANALGIDQHGLRLLVKAGSVRRVIRGWYAVRSPGAERAPWEGSDVFGTARLQHRLVTVALLKAFDGRAVASHQSALILHGVDLWEADLATAHLCRTSTDHTRHRPGAVIHPLTSGKPVTTGEGFTTVPLATAIVQAGLYPPAEPSRRKPMESLVAADHALHQGWVTQDQLAQALAEHTHHPGIQAVRVLLAHADGRHESVGETRLAHAMRRLGYRFTPQVPLTVGGQTFYGDFGLDDEPVVIEFDGLAKYSLGRAGVAADTDAARQGNFAREKWREDRLREAGTYFARFVWRELGDLDLIQRRIDGAVERARLSRPA
jgi:hypothetical protein